MCKVIYLFLSAMFASIGKIVQISCEICNRILWSIVRHFCQTFDQWITKSYENNLLKILLLFHSFRYYDLNIHDAK